LSTIAAIDPGVPTKAITSSRGKILRAEPISALWEQRRGHLVGNFPELEDQMTSFTTDWDRSRGSPDRVDALVFGASELTSGAAPGGYFNETALLVDGGPAARPAYIRQVFGTLVTTPRSGAAVGLVILASSGERLLIVDWRLVEMEQALSIEWLTAACKLLCEYSTEYRSLSGAPTILVESDDFGASAYELALVHYYQTHQVINLSKIERRRKAPIPTLDQLVEAARPKINSGIIKLAQPALEREAPFRSGTANHLLAQLRRFSPDERAAPVELVTALCVAIEQWLGGELAGA
jgi:hypothetical protein